MLTQDRGYFKGMILTIIAVLGIVLAFVVAAQLTYSELGPTPPGPTPLPLSLAYLPLPEAAITPGPAVTPDWENVDIFVHDLNSEVEIYSNRFGMQWSVNKSIRLTAGVANGQYTWGAVLWHAGEVEGREWSYSVIFPWPQDEQPVQTIDGTTRIDSSSSRSPDARGPAVAEFIEWAPNLPPGESDEIPLARCRYHVHGQITLTSVSPVVGNFQFACQFDATEYALVSGWFWE